MGYLKYVRKAWKDNPDLFKQRLIVWRKQPATLRLDHPTRIDRARSLGYKAKPGILIVRQRVNRGGRMRERIRAGRKPKQFRRVKILGMSYQWVAEIRAQKHHPNCEVLNSYFVGKDGLHYWYEIILLDKAHPQILADPQYSWVHNPVHKGRVFRGLTASGKRSRGLLTNKGKGAEKLRPSLRANKRLAK